jgi:hypothetical protein
MQEFTYAIDYHDFTCARAKMREVQEISMYQSATPSGASTMFYGDVTGTTVYRLEGSQCGSTSAIVLWH